MAVNCSKISGNVVAASCHMTTAAIMGDCVLVNFDDWQAATITRNATNAGVIEGITLAGQTKGSHITSHDKAFTASYEMSKGSYTNGYKHKLVLRSFDRSQAVKDFVSKAAFGRFVALVINRDNGVDQTKYEVLGSEQGLVVETSTFDSSNADGIVNEITFSSEDGILESRVPDSLYKTSLTATKAIYDGLYTA